MEPKRSVCAHKLFRASRSRASGEDLPQDAAWTYCVAAVGQLHSCSIYQQLVRDSIISSHAPCKITVALDSGQKHNAHSPTPGVSKTATNKQSKLEKDRLDWILPHKILQKIILAQGHCRWISLPLN